jgi:dynein intermediate chain, cytosolic
MTDVELTPRSPKKQAPDSAASPSKQRALTLESESGDVAMGLSEDDKKQIMQSDAMEAFLLKASRVIERAMTSAIKYDIMVDYGATVEEDIVTEEATETLKQLFTFRDDQWTRCRAVTDVDMSPFYPELMLVAYTARDFLDEEDKDHVSTGAKQWDTMGTTNASAFSDLSRTTEGVVMLWSTALPTRPEYRFTCHSQVTSACFNPFDRNIIFGGTYSGQIVVWDTRAKSAPVQKTSLSSGSHTHPIYSLAVVGTKSAYQYVLPLCLSPSLLYLC